LVGLLLRRLLNLRLRLLLGLWLRLGLLDLRLLNLLRLDGRLTHVG
jgi:hypothetical protein